MGMANLVSLEDLGAKLQEITQGGETNDERNQDSGNAIRTESAEHKEGQSVETEEGKVEATGTDESDSGNEDEQKIEAQKQEGTKKTVGEVGGEVEDKTEDVDDFNPMEQLSSFSKEWFERTMQSQQEEVQVEQVETPAPVPVQAVPKFEFTEEMFNEAQTSRDGFQNVMTGMLQSFEQDFLPRAAKEVGRALAPIIAGHFEFLEVSTAHDIVKKYPTEYQALLAQQVDKTPDLPRQTLTNKTVALLKMYEKAGAKWKARNPVTKVTNVDESSQATGAGKQVGARKAASQVEPRTVQDDLLDFNRRQNKIKNLMTPVN